MAGSGRRREAGREGVLEGRRKGEIGGMGGGREGGSCFPHVIVTRTNKLRVCSWGK